MLFKKANTEQFTYKFHEESHEILGYKELCFLFGMLLGKALFDRIPVSLSLNHQILYALLNQEPDWSEELSNFRHIDASVYNSIKFFQENSLSNYEDVIEQYFTTSDAQGNEKALKDDGTNIRVTDENKAEFIRLKCAYYAKKQCEGQLTEMRRGFNKVICSAWVEHLTVDEFEAQLCGRKEISLADWRAHTELKGFKMGSYSPTVRLFWQVMETYDQVHLQRLL